jgi:hypothetical protein
MLIEVIKPAEGSSTEQGNLLEDVCAEFLRTQGYEVKTQVRVTASELDLLCVHKVSQKEVYVECKAQRENLSAGVLKNLLGTVDLHDYSEGWLISAGPLGKDAKGFVDQWEKKEKGKRDRLSIYTPDRIVDALTSAKIICEYPELKAHDLKERSDLSFGEWSLVISPWGKYWACPILITGIAKSAALFSANTGNQVCDIEVLEKVWSTNFSLRSLQFVDAIGSEKSERSQQKTAVVEVEYGEKWFDYRPARPEHFVGRRKAQNDLLQFFSDVKKNRSESRVFAIKGDSGIGKSSLIAKVRDVARRSQKPNKLFLYAVDMRAANDASYVSSALVAGLRSASESGFGANNQLQVTNYTDPLASESIASFLRDCGRKHELVILVLDQFEELYSKTQLFPVFEEAKKLMFSVIAASSSFVLGFAWKTDSTVPQDHPAYHMWHELSDHRFEISLKPFSHADAEHSMQMFEEELHEKVRPELRKYLLENCQGYPWLLKKLCIHFYEQLQSGASQHQLANESLDISSLFDQDLSSLTDAETGCLKLVAKNAPMDWYEVLENAGHEVVQSLQNKRLLIRRGDKLNLYWDIFRDYVLSNRIPPIPFTYIPQSPSLDALLRVSLELDDVEGKSNRALAEKSKLEESTVRNIVHDLVQFGIVCLNNGEATIERHFKDLNARTVLTSLRVLFKRHALTEMLRRNNATKPADTDQIIGYLKGLNPTAQYHSRTWTAYATKLTSWLVSFGLVERSAGGLVFKDFGDIREGDVKRWSAKRRRIVFLGDASPAKVIEVLETVRDRMGHRAKMMDLGYRNACAVLYRFNLIELSSSGEYVFSDAATAAVSAAKAVWDEALKEESLSLVIDRLRREPYTTPVHIGKLVSDHFERNWTRASWARIGNGLRQWALWLISPPGPGRSLPEPPGRTSTRLQPQMDLFSGDD